jgi:hypothetical protein
MSKLWKWAKFDIRIEKIIVESASSGRFSKKKDLMKKPYRRKEEK